MSMVSVKGRKTRRVTTSRSPLPDTEMVAHMLARGLENALRSLVATSVSAIVLEARVAKVAEGIEGIQIPSVIAVTGISSTESRGLVVLDSDLAYNMIDLMLGGDAAVAPPPIARSFTQIDMALSGLAVEAALLALAEALAASLGRASDDRFEILSRHQDITQLRFAQTSSDVLLLNLALDIGPAARSGCLLFFLPLALLDVICALNQKQGTRPREAVEDLWRVNMRLAASHAPVRVDAVLQTRRMSLGQVMDLRPGTVLPLPEGVIDEVRLVIGQPGGGTAELGVGRLGLREEHRAVALREDLDPRIIASARAADPRP